MPHLNKSRRGITMKNRHERKTLDWHLGDIEQRCGFSGGKYTDVNFLFALIVSAVIAAGFFIGLCHVPQNVREMKCFAMLLARGWTPFVMVYLLLLAIVILFVKWRKLAFQRKATKIELVPPGQGFSLSAETAQDVLAKLNAQVDDPKRFVLLNRIERALLNLRNVGNVSDVSEMLRAQAENDESHTDSSYGLLNGIVWILPILGFIGTVSGLSGAIGGFGAVLTADSAVSTLKDSLAPVTANLGVAFDTTFVALVFAMVLQVLVTLLRKSEERFLDECRDYAHVNVISRLRIAKDVSVEGKEEPSA